MLISKEKKLIKCRFKTETLKTFISSKLSSYVTISSRAVETMETHSYFVWLTYRTSDVEKQ